MNIEQKLAYSERSDRVYFFRERMFLKLYGMSLYIGVTELKLPVTLELKRYKLLENKPILQGILQRQKLKSLSVKRMIETNYSYILKGNWAINNENYRVWYSEYVEKLMAQEIKQKDFIEIEKNLDEGLKALWLTEDEYRLIKNWREGDTQAFQADRLIMELQRKIASSGA